MIAELRTERENLEHAILMLERIAAGKVVDAEDRQHG
jgi:hypothetical protein